jgi:hypothetical protein
MGMRCTNPPDILDTSVTKVTMRHMGQVVAEVEDSKRSYNNQPLVTSALVTAGQCISPIAALVTSATDCSCRS